MILYVLAFIILCIALFFLYIRLRYQFWSLQPVFHFYDLYYWFVNVGIIRHELPDKNRYTNFFNIITKPFENIDSRLIKEAILLIQLNYLRNKENTYSPKKENIVPYFKGHNSKTFWTYYLEPEILIDNRTGKTVEEKKIIGFITSRPLHVRIINSLKDAIFDVYYVDYLCVQKNRRKKNIAPQLIQTHEYNQSWLSNKDKEDICVSLFKREEELTGIIPLTVYKTYCFNLKNWYVPDLLDSRINLLTGDKQNMYYFYNFIIETTNKNKKKFDIVIYPEMANILELISTGNLYIKMLIINGEIKAVYVFRKTCTFIEKDKEIISLIASIYKEDSGLTKNEFIEGFKVALWSIIKENKNFGYLVVEDISDNTVIINNISVKTNPLIISPMAYFFYNFAYSPFKSEKCFILN